MIRLAQLRIDAGMNAQQLADAAGVAYQTVLNIEDGKGARVDTLHKLAAVLEARPSELTMDAIPPAEAA